MSDKKNYLARQEFPCSSQQVSTDTLVLLHGWGSASQSWQPVIPVLQCVFSLVTLDLPGFGESPEIPDFTLDAVIELIAAELPEKCVLVGWSLGGMLCVQLAARYPQKISRIITLAANVKFVADRRYESAMPSGINRQFNKNFSADPIATLTLFGGLLAQGDANERALLKQVRALVQTSAINPNWLQALQLLSTLDNRNAFSQLQQPGLHLLAENDVLVPSSAANQLVLLNTRQQIIVVPQTAHALQWSQPAVVAEKIKYFLRSSLLDKKQVAQSFSRAAETYDSVAGLQRQVGDISLKKIDPDSSKKIIIDVGCGTGYFTPQLQHLFPESHIIGVDLAEGMVRFARDQHSNLVSWICADAEALPFADQSVDIMYSNFALQWCVNLPRLFAELQRILKPGGDLIFTTLGENTLHELKSAWQQVDNRIHVNEFHRREVIVNSLRHQGFDEIEMEHKPVIMEFEHLTDLTHSLKALGAQNINRGRAAGLTGRKSIQLFKRAYEKFRNNKNLLPATYDVFYIKAKKL